MCSIYKILSKTTSIKQIFQKGDSILNKINGIKSFIPDVTYCIRDNFEEKERRIVGEYRNKNTNNHLYYQHYISSHRMVLTEKKFFNEKEI